MSEELNAQDRLIKPKNDEKSTQRGDLGKPYLALIQEESLFFLLTLFFLLMIQLDPAVHCPSYHEIQNQCAEHCWDNHAKKHDENLSHNVNQPI